MNVSDVGRQIVRAWPIILLALTLGGALGWWSASSKPASYVAETLVTVDVGPETQLADGQVIQGSLLESYTASFSALAQSSLIVNPTLREMGVGTSVDDLVTSKTLEVSGPGPGILSIRGTGRTPEEAESLSSGVAESFVDEVNSGALTLLNLPTRAAVVGNTQVAKKSPAAGPITMAILGGFAGMVIGLACVGVWVSTRKRVETLDGLEQIALNGQPVLGSLTITQSGANGQGSNSRAIAVQLTGSPKPESGSVITIVVDDRYHRPEVIGQVLAAGIDSLGYPVSLAVQVDEAPPVSPEGEVKPRGNPVAQVQTLEGRSLRTFSMPPFEGNTASEFGESIEKQRATSQWVVVPVARSDSGTLALLAQRFTDILVLTVAGGHCLVSSVEGDLRSMAEITQQSPQLVLLQGGD